MGSNANAFAFKCILNTFEKYLHLHLKISNEKYLHLHLKKNSNTFQMLFIQTLRNRYCLNNTNLSHNNTIYTFSNSSWLHKLKLYKIIKIASSLLLLTLEIYHMMNKELFDLISNTPKITKCSKRFFLGVSCCGLLSRPE